MAKRAEKFHGRVEGAQATCAVAGCREPGEFRAPLTAANFDGPGDYRYLCLDHVREHNSEYDYFAGMTDEEIAELQSPIPRRERRARAFAFSRSGDPGPAWGDFDDPLDAIAARFRDSGSMRQAKARSRFSGVEQHALSVLGLSVEASLHEVRQAYSHMVRRFHPDRNGGDRSHEGRLAKVIEAYQTLRKSPAFA